MGEKRDTQGRPLEGSRKPSRVGCWKSEKGVEREDLGRNTKQERMAPGEGPVESSGSQ
jgi:hypothetical protein